MAADAQKQVKTVLGNLDFKEVCSLLSESQMNKERGHYFTVPRIQNTPLQHLLPQMTICSKRNEATEKGEWLLIGEAQKLRVRAFIATLAELEEEVLKGKETLKPVVEKMIAAAAEVQVTVCKYEDDLEFIKNYQAGEDADQKQMQHTNQRFTNRAKMFMRARIQISNLQIKDKIEAKDIVQYFQELEAKNKIRTTFKANRVTCADDVKRIEKQYTSLQNWHLIDLYESLEYTEECGPTPLSGWSTARFFLKTVENDGDIASYVLRVLEKVILGPEDLSKTLNKAKVLESGKKTQQVMRAITLQFKMMRDLLDCLEKKQVATPEKMKADFEILRKCLDFTAFAELQKDTTGIVQNLTFPAQLLYDLCAKIVSQKLYGKFAEAEQNNPSYQKMYTSSALTELYAPITTKWEEAHHQFIPKLEKVETDNEPTADEPGHSEVKLTRHEAKKRYATADRDGYIKSYVLTGDEAVDRQNLQAFHVCRTTRNNAPENPDTKAWPDILLNHDLASPCIVLNTINHSITDREEHSFCGPVVQHQPLKLCGGVNPALGSSGWFVFNFQVRQDARRCKTSYSWGHCAVQGVVTGLLLSKKSYSMRIFCIAMNREI